MGGGGLFGGGGGAQPPTLDTAASQRLTRSDYELKEEFVPRLTGVTGTAGRDEYARNLSFALRGFTNPASVVYAGEIADTNKALAAAQDRLAKLQSAQRSGAGGIFGVATGNQFRDPTRGWRPMSEYQSEVDKAQAEINRLNKQASDYAKADPVGDLQRVFAPEFAARDRLLGQMESAQASTPEYLRMQQSLAQGLQRGELGESLYQTAMERAQSQGRLTPEANRDAVQAARAGMAARGMATGNAALGAELLNRDRYTRARQAEDLSFASGVQAQDLDRRQFNMGALQTSSQAAEAERVRQMGLGESAYNFRLQTNPNMMLAGLGSPYANFTPQAIALMGGQNVQPIYSGGTFSQGNRAGSTIAGGLGGALSGAAAGTMVNPGLGTAIGAGVGALGGLFGSMR